VYELNDLLLLLQSSQPIISIETHEEQRALDLIKRCQVKLNKRIVQWSVTKGLVDASTGRPTLELASKGVTADVQQSKDPKQALIDISSSKTPSVYVLLDFHPYLDDPFAIRAIKEIAQDHAVSGNHLVFISPELKMPADINRFTAQFTISLPDKAQLRKLITAELKVWKMRNQDRKLKADRRSIELLSNNLAGLTVAESQRLIRNAIYDDDAISHCDLERVQKAKYELLGQGGVLNFEYDTANFNQVGGLSSLKNWLEIRRTAFSHHEDSNLDKPKGILLVGIQGSGKSLAARAVAGVWGVPLLRLDFGTLYNKFFGETEKNMRHAIELAEVMSPCVLWIDEIEKGISTGDYDSGTSQRLLATLLTWMAENKQAVFIVATANNIDTLPPELIRKGRLDEIFFVDLPAADTREDIFRIHLDKRGIEHSGMDLQPLREATEGFSGAEIEQAVVSALYHAQAVGETLNVDLLMTEVSKTQPLSVVMAEKISSLRHWAQGRTVMAN
jgi:SpoVK/Ycf46/Vps4 family AAA+-type ATPase